MGEWPYQTHRLTVRQFGRLTNAYCRHYAYDPEAGHMRLRDTEAYQREVAHVLATPDDGEAFVVHVHRKAIE